MRSLFLSLVLCLSALACAQQQPPASPAAPETPKKVAEGAYDKWDSWTLSGLADANQWVAEIDMQVYDKLAEDSQKPASQKETMRMDSDFTMRGFRYESKNFKGMPDGALECTVNPESLDCVSEFPGEDRGKGRIEVGGGGYATQFGVHIALLDIPWFFTTLVAQSDRDPKRPRTFGIVTIAFDGRTPDTLVTGGLKDADVHYVGPETIRLFGRNVNARKFTIDAHTYAATAWTADSGLLLRADWADMRIELTRYKQWAPLVPELPIEPAPAAKP